MRVLCLLLGLLLAYAQQPIPNVNQFNKGHTKGNCNAPIVYEEFMDHLCSDSMDAQPTVDQVVVYYGNQLCYIVHVFPLPYHHNAFLAAQGGAAVSSQKGEPGWWSWYYYMYQVQAKYYDTNSWNDTESDIVNMLADDAVTCCGVNRTQFINDMQHGTDIYTDSVDEWKLGASRAVWGTPTFFVNGVVIADADPSWNLSDWQAVLNPLLPTKSDKYSRFQQRIAMKP